MTKYTDHQHEWEVDYNVQGLSSIQCSKCHIVVELYNKHLSLTDYKDDCTARKTLRYDELLPTTLAPNQ